MSFPRYALTASRASVATLVFLASNSSVNTFKIFALCGGKNACQNACWGASLNPAVCGAVLTLRALTLGHFVPKQKCWGTAKAVPQQVGKCGKYLAISVQDI